MGYYPIFPVPSTFFLKSPDRPISSVSKTSWPNVFDTLKFHIAWTRRLSYINLKYLETRSTTSVLEYLEIYCYLSSSIISIKSTYSPSNSFMDLLIASLRFEALIISSFDLFTSLRLSR